MNSRIETDPFRALMEAGAGEPLRRSMIHQMERFWEGQRKLLDEYESLSRAMFERRRSAAASTLDALRKMSAATDGAEWTKCCSDWLTGSFSRVAEDSRDMIEESWKVFAEVSQALTEGMADTAQASAETAKAAAETQQSAARSAASETFAAAQSATAHSTAAAQEAAHMAAARAAQRPKRHEEGARGQGQG